MSATILLARGSRLLSIPQSEFDRHLAMAPDRHRQRQAFMSEAHHRMRYFVVQALAREGRPLSPQAIAQQLSLLLRSRRAGQEGGREGQPPAHVLERVEPHQPDVPDRRPQPLDVAPCFAFSASSGIVW